MKIKYIILTILLLILALGSFAVLTHDGIIPNVLNLEILNSKYDYRNEVVEKPVIYLYPEEETEINVELNYQGTLIADYPRYNELINGWSVIASPDGKLINKDDSKEYSYIFWEGIPKENIDWDISTGFVVKGEDTIEFLQDKLVILGLKPSEYNEFIVYWYPRMKDNPYNLIHFAEDQYTSTAPLNITPVPDSIQRVFMVFKPLQNKVEIEKQILKPFSRKGFSVIEWGGALID